MKKKRWLGSLLNFILPGLGNFYSRKIKKGILTYILLFVVVLSLRFIAFNFTLLLLALAIIIAYYFYAIISGYRDVKKGYAYKPVFYDKWYVYILLLALNYALLSSIKGPVLDNLTPINFASIPTPAMSPTLVQGDILAFNKTKAIERNNLVIFWFPDDINTKYVKRCIGLPGDTLRIKSAAIFINDQVLPDLPLKFKYLVSTEGSRINPTIFQKNQITEHDYLQISNDTYQFFFTEQQAKVFSDFQFINKVELLIAPEGQAEPIIFPKSKFIDWNTDFYGPIYIPKKGDIIQLTEKNIDIYLKCIKFENESVEKVNTELKVNGQLITTYEFKENYFFMMGDNRHNSFDSRYWGLLPQELVIGKALYLNWGLTKERIGKKLM